MTKITFCGLTRACDIENANELRPEYVGFVFAQKSKRFICTKGAADRPVAMEKGSTCSGSSSSRPIAA